MLRSLVRLAAHPRLRAAREFLAPPPYEGTRWTRKRLLNLYLSRYEMRRCRVRLRSLPTKLTVEATNVCNLRCPACFTGAGEVGRVRSMMTLDLYRRLLAELGDYLFELEFFNWGEPLLSKFIFTMIAEAHARGISTTISTNFSIPFDAGRAEQLVASGLTVLGVSIDGARQETYEQYRVRGDLERVLANSRLVNDAKIRLGSRTPRMVWEFHVFPHNVDDIERAREHARELGMEIAVSKGWVVGPDWDQDGKWRDYLEPVAGPCRFLWTQGVVHNDGGVAPCCGTFYREDDVGHIAVKPGDLGAQSFRAVWNGETFRMARALYRSRNGDARAKSLICADCPQTIIWENWKQHRAAGKSPESFKPGYSTNDCFQFFFNHRPARAAGGGAALPKARAGAPVPLATRRAQGQ